MFVNLHNSTGIKSTNQADLNRVSQFLGHKIEQNKEISTKILGKIKNVFTSLTQMFPARKHRHIQRQDSNIGSIHAQNNKTINIENAQKIIKETTASNCHFKSLDLIKEGNPSGFEQLKNDIENLNPSERIQVLEILFKNPESSPLYISNLDASQKEMLANAIDKESCTELKALKTALTGEFGSLCNVFDSNNVSKIINNWNALKQTPIDPQKQEIQTLLNDTKQLVEQLKTFTASYNACVPAETVPTARGAHITQASLRISMPLDEYNKHGNIFALEELFNNVQNQYQTVDLHRNFDKITKSSHYEKVEAEISNLIKDNLNNIDSRGNREEMKIAQYIDKKLEENPSYSVTDSEKVLILKYATGLPDNKDIDLSKFLNKFNYDVKSALSQIANLKNMNLTEEDTCTCVKKFTDDNSNNSLTDIADAMQKGKILGADLDASFVKQLNDKFIELNKRHDEDGLRQEIQALKAEINKKEPGREIDGKDILGYMEAFLSDNTANSLKDVYLSEAKKAYKYPESLTSPGSAPNLEPSQPRMHALKKRPIIAERVQRNSMSNLTPTDFKSFNASLPERFRIQPEPENKTGRLYKDMSRAERFAVRARAYNTPRSANASQPLNPPPPPTEPAPDPKQIEAELNQ